MKNKLTVAVLVLATLFFANCKKTEKKETQEAKEKQYVIDSESLSINWTAYKTTEKIPVKGVFSKYEVTATPAASINEALNGVKVEIPAASIFSKDSIRDGKLVQFFFDVMEKTTTITGKLEVLNESSANLHLKLNGVTKELPMTMTIENNTVALEGTMVLDNWNAQTALASLHEACKALHTGPDGVSKTWNDVKIEVTATLKQE